MVSDERGKEIIVCLFPLFVGHWYFQAS
jgi:hypothetical protein